MKNTEKEILRQAKNFVVFTEKALQYKVGGTIYPIKKSAITVKKVIVSKLLKSYYIDVVTYKYYDRNYIIYHNMGGMKARGLYKDINEKLKITILK